MSTPEVRTGKKRAPTAAECAAGYAGNMRRHRGPNHPETRAAEREQATEMILNYSKKIIESFPPLTDAQVSRITTLLRSEGAA